MGTYANTGGEWVITFARYLFLHVCFSFCFSFLFFLFLFVCFITLNNYHNQTNKNKKKQKEKQKEKQTCKKRYRANEITHSPPVLEFVPIIRYSSCQGCRHFGNDCLKYERLHRLA